MWEYNSTCIRESRYTKRSMIQGVNQELAEHAHLHGVDSFNLWSRLVEDYTYRAFTFLQDRLVALARLAEKHKHRTEDKYLAGLWRSDLPRALLWQEQPPLSTRPAMYVAPSWSWASMDDGQRGVNWDQTLIKLEQIKVPDLIFEIEDCDIEESLPGS